MSSDPLYVEFKDGAKLWGFYYGTCDAILTRLFDTQDEAETAYSKEDGWGRMFVPDEVVKRAEQTAEPVRFFTTYGSGAWRELNWNGHASRTEKVVVGPYVNPGWHEYPGPNSRWLWND